MGGEEFLMLLLLAIVIRLLGDRGKLLLAEAESVAAHALARLGGLLWNDLSDSEWSHAQTLAPSDKPSPRQRKADYRPGYSRLLCWKIWVGDPFHSLSPDRQRAIAAYYEGLQYSFYWRMSTLSSGADRTLYQAIAVEEALHLSFLPPPCQRCQRWQGLAIAALLLWDLPRIYLGLFRYFLPAPGDKGYLGK
jgi:hypothetical protein